MHPYAEPTKITAEKRPSISEVVKGPTGGSSFTVTFPPGQVLPTHRNRSRILINVIQGDGAITVDADLPIRLVTGSVVQVAPHAPHALVAGEEGMLVEVHLVADCCAAC
jgi:quercetin dioxygenase-like cupin family protein